MVENWDKYKDLEYYPDRVCGCGCEGKIKVQPHHKWYGIPKFIRGHNNAGRLLVPRETRTCAAPGCNNTFACKVTSKRRYCCHWHGRLGKKDSKETIEKRSNSHRRRWQDPEFKRRRIREIQEACKTPEYKKKQIEAIRNLVKTPEYKKKLRDGIEKRRSNPNWQNSGFLPRERHVNWQGGTSNEPYPFEFNKLFKENVRKKYGYVCQVCKLTQEQVGKTLLVHHIDYDKSNLSVYNFVPLCSSCHSVTNGKKNRDYWTKVFQSVVSMNKSSRETSGNRYYYQ